MNSKRLSIAPGTAIVLIALFLALGGSAFAVGEAGRTTSAAAQRCSQGAVRGIAHVTAAVNVPGRYTGSKVVFARKYNCTGRATQVRRLGIGIYEVRFAGNGAPTAVASGGGGVLASADRVGGGVFRVTTYPAGRADPADYPFVVVLV